MNIFYYSVHQILEDDEIRLLQELGHNVFCFGKNRIDGALESFRPSLRFNSTERDMFNDYELRGGTFDLSQDDHSVLPPGFEGHFSTFIIMHDVKFISRFWHRLKSKTVIWRTIGQGVDAFEDIVRPMRDEGLKIVRYSPVEKGISRSCGEDAIIRFYKNQTKYRSWNGQKEDMLMFSNHFQQRYPVDAAAFTRVSHSVSCVVGGAGNAEVPGSFGCVDYDEQLERYRDHRAYLLMSGLDIPYTLNFIEAWMTGIPIVIFAPTDRVGKFYEIDQLIDNGESGFICRTIDVVIDRCKLLQHDRNVASRIGAAGRNAAIELFGVDKISDQWRAFL